MELHRNPARQSAYARQLAAGFPWLRFAPRLEARFRRRYRRELMPRIRAALVLGVVLYALTFIVDLFFLPRTVWVWTGVPRLLVVGVALMNLAVSYARSSYRVFDVWMMASALSASLALIPIAIVAAQNGVTAYFASFGLVAIYLYSMSGLLFYQATICVLVVDLAMITSGLWVGLPGEVFLYQLVALLIANCIGVYGCYMLNHHARSNFLRMRLLNAMAERDGLTGVYNRSYFAHAAAGIWAQAARERKPLALMMVDVDLFKVFNDRHGHPAGDRCLIEVGAILARHARRPLDVLARYGGEEFVVLCYDLGYDAARKTCEAVRAEVAALEMEQPGDGSCASVTISVGVALVLPEQKRRADLRALLEASDQALYAAKSGGRNQCVVRRLRAGHAQRAVGG